MDEQFDVLVLGSGVAGLTAALAAAEWARVLVLAKDSLDETGTALAQGGIAAVFGPDDSFDSHARDTLKAGAGLSDPDVVELCVREAPAAIAELAQLGVGFERAADNGKEVFDLGREGGHSRRRIVHSKDQTGRRMEDVLLEKVRVHPSITVRDLSLAVDFITLGSLEGGHPGDGTTDDRCIGSYVMDKRTGAIHTVGAGATIVATGGAGKVYLYTSNPDVSTGDGVAMAARAGARIADMEFFQFHPTCLYHPLTKNFLISEAVRGEGGILVTASGDRFMPGYHEDAELASRDTVARAIDAELKRTGDDCVYLDLTHRDASFIEGRFPGIFSYCYSLGLDIRTEPIPVVPAAHYQCGGVKVDDSGWTGLPGLYAVGEVACTGMHGANRLASNSLLEALVFSKRAAATAHHWLREVPAGPTDLPRWQTGMARHPDESVVITQNWDEIRRLMWNFVGVVRSDNRLARARKRLAAVQEEVRADYWSFILTPDLVELRNLADVSQLILDMAIARKESRGLHYNLDYPDRDDRNWKRHSVVRRPGKRR